jgi:uncharacterized protein DUF4258
MKGRYLVSTHADVERAREGFALEDLLSCVYSGDIIETDFDALRGTEFLVEGVSSTHLRMRIKLGIADEGEAVFITVYSRRTRRRGR